MLIGEQHLVGDRTKYYIVFMYLYLKTKREKTLRTLIKSIILQTTRNNFTIFPKKLIKVKLRLADDTWGIRHDLYAAIFNPGLTFSYMLEL